MVINIFLTIIVVIGCLGLFYLVVKAAVRDGVIEANKKDIK